jgi:hypothetical protein
VQNEEELAAVQEALRESTKRLKRGLQDSPNVADNMARVQAERAKLQGLLHKTMLEVSVNVLYRILETISIIQNAPCLEKKGPDATMQSDGEHVL